MSMDAIHIVEIVKRENKNNMIEEFHAHPTPSVPAPRFDLWIVSPVYVYRQSSLQCVQGFTLS